MKKLLTIAVAMMVLSSAFADQEKSQIRQNFVDLSVSPKCLWGRRNACFALWPRQQWTPKVATY
ncbi:MAG: hypothetical protein E5V92_32340 [Mesorhizobium sp.]|nr:MAG: hypothetical protein E5V78_22835 [Mesorhizobium sp.]TIW14559.1 MAG: hypothetical protein E5V81_27100 [Mesorhizobium sp.]TJW73670.1 MAG: hypothetical protein E5V92_32340 [Mesorhizobium sp.]